MTLSGATWQNRTMDISRDALARMIDHTLLKTDATPDQVSALIEEAKDLGTYSVCISPSMLPVEADLGQVKLATVCGFPSGNHTPAAKAAEAAESSKLGADEIDMVINISYLKEGKPERVVEEIEAVRAVTSGVLKVIIESAALTDEEIVAACQAAETAGADYVKTSTGFHPAGGASVEAITLMAETVGGRLGIKASGGIRDWETAQAVVAAGATRLGLSGSRAVLDGGSSEGY